MPRARPPRRRLHGCQQARAGWRLTTGGNVGTTQSIADNARIYRIQRAFAPQLGIALRTGPGTDGPVAHPPSCAAVGSSRSTYACSGSWQRRDSSVHGHPSRDAGPDIVAWLLDGDDPSVRYFTLTLFGEPADGVAAAKARRRIMTEGAVPSSWRHSARRVIGANVSACTPPSTPARSGSSSSSPNSARTAATSACAVPARPSLFAAVQAAS